MKKITSDKIITEMVRDFSKVGKPSKSEIRTRLQKLVSDIIGATIADTSKAFGGCTKCYGKGYATTRVGTSSKLGAYVKTWMKPCTCDRGKQLEKFIGENSLKQTVC